MTAGDAADGRAPKEEREGGGSERSRGVALGLAVIGGMFGLHRFYTGRAASGVCMCLTLGGLGIWYLYDIVVIAAGDFEDGDGCRLRRWEVGDAAPRLASSERRVAGSEEHTSEIQSPCNLV